MSAGFHFSKYVLQRIPIFPIAHIEKPLSEILCDPIFQAALYLASPQFYERLLKADFDISKLNTREVTTALRYFNRACYRATPFGYFASVNIGTWEYEGHIHLSETIEELRPYFQPSEWLVQFLQRKIVDGEPAACYEPNPTLYRIKKHFRFIRDESGNRPQRSYQLQSSLYSLILNGLLKFCRNGQSEKRIIDRICRDANCDAGEGLEYFEFLKDAQILIPKHRATITGKAALLMDHITVQSTDLYFFKNDYQDTLKSRSIRYAPELRQLDAVLGTLTTDPTEGKSMLNTILVRQAERATLDSGHQQALVSGIFALDRLCPADQLPSVKEFIKKFHKHFEGERIPLLLALDPELGIGYQTESYESPNPLLETVNIRPRGDRSVSSAWTAAHQCLMAAWLAMEKQQASVIELNETALMALPGSDPMVTNLGSSILFTLSEEGVNIESAGGCNPLSLIGRFTLADQAIFQAGREIANEIEKLNPNLIFAEILHLADPHIDNVNRRGQLWNYQLPLHAACEPGAKAEMIRLDDLYVVLAGTMVLLWSKKHEKYVIPRLTSAYNHSIDQLPLFRFLSDLSYQYGRTQLSFNLLQFFPGFSYYPRVNYQGAILSLATWVISEAEYSALGDSENWTDAYRTFADRHHLPQKFMVSEGDQQLVFDQCVPEDMVLFRETMRSSKQMILREYLPLNANKPVITSRSGNQYHLQCNAFMLPDEPMNLPEIPDHAALEHSRVQRKFIPGTEWLYLKLYVPRLSVNRLLLQLQSVIRKRFPHGRISRWFFIRFEDHAPHVRLRFKIDPQDIDAILAALRQVLEANVHQHLIREYQLDVYSRELERYQAGGIEETEEFFWYSSSFVVQFLKMLKAGANLPVFLAAAVTVKWITESFYEFPEHQMGFWQFAYECYFSEFEGKKLKIELDQKYRETSKALNDILQHKDPFQDKQLQQWLKKMQGKGFEIGKKLNNDESKRDYLLSLIHVHLNRMFVDQQRQQEMVVYFLLVKWMRSQIARQKNRFKQADPS